MLEGTGPGCPFPDYKRPREWNGLEALSWLMDLLGMELVGRAGPHQLCCVVGHCRPVEPAAESLADQGARQRVVPAVSSMYVSQQLFPLFPRNASQIHIIWLLPV